MDESTALIYKVEKHKEFENVIIVTTVDNMQWHYYMDSKGLLTLGQTWVVTHGKYWIAWFNPLAPGMMPIVLDVKVL